MLYAIKLIAQRLYTKQKMHFIKAVPIIAQLYTLESANEMVAINAMLCVAELSALLKVTVNQFCIFYVKIWSWYNVIDKNAAAIPAVL